MSDQYRGSRPHGRPLAYYAPPQWQAALDADTFAAAWGMSLDEIAMLLGVSEDVLDGWRRSEDAGWSDETAERVEKLHRIHELLWISYPFSRWATWWRRRWRENSPLGERSPMEVVVNAPAAIDVLIGQLTALAQPGFS